MYTPTEIFFKVTPEGLNVVPTSFELLDKHKQHFNMIRCIKTDNFTDIDNYKMLINYADMNGFFVCYVFNEDIEVISKSHININDSNKKRSYIMLFSQVPVQYI